MAFKKADCFRVELEKCCLTAESVQSAALPLESIDHLHGSDSLPLGMLGVGDSVTDDILKEDLEDTTSLLVDESRDTLDSTTTRQTPDGGLGDALDVVTQHLTVTLGASLSQSLASFTTSSHCCSSVVTDVGGEVAGNICTSARQLMTNDSGGMLAGERVLYVVVTVVGKQSTNL